MKNDTQNLEKTARRTFPERLCQEIEVKSPAYDLLHVLDHSPLVRHVLDKLLLDLDHLLVVGRSHRIQPLVPLLDRLPVSYLEIFSFWASALGSGHRATLGP